VRLECFKIFNIQGEKRKAKNASCALRHKKIKKVVK
jgi:hypothetical protein